ncbi:MULTISPECIES: SMI1/KNR4 family protein [Streptomyces]|uniref:SMI1/KNR4 family protein n=1 Tax=Streptomyces TaxID=1883 RepID=UPI001E470C22|nr:MULTISPECIES: SMI1/KNR4 family protein [Streptomyces]UFQ15991.1 SMI1/KNR4 family protein [Streptomyces huasconensis]WCL85594.1 SMI1/KNR4 family protein [Streptomyces sp. JCM 35825]
MTTPISESWTRIETWLARHAPRTFAALEPPADRSAIAAAEQAIGRPFPDALTESLLWHDGTGDYVLLPPFWMLLSTQIIVAGWQLRMRIYGEELADAEEGDPDDEYGPWWHAQWTPFAADGAGDNLVIDQRSYRRRGRIGNADHETGCSFRSHPMWASLTTLLDATATALETGEAVDGYLPVVVDEGELDWEIL